MKGNVVNDVVGSVIPCIRLPLCGQPSPLLTYI